MPKLNDNQIQIMSDRYDIHGGAEDHPEGANSYGGPINQAGEPDTSIPPADASGKAKHTIGRSGSGSGSSVSGDNTRVPTPTA
jgi:hypothetical protein